MIKIQVTKDDIKYATGRNCRNCPIANAINRILPSLGFNEHYAWVEPHGGWFSDPVGIEIRRNYSTEPVLTIPVDDLPEEVTDFARNFDDWDDVRHEGWREFKKRTGAEYRPDKPIPFSFELDLTPPQGGRALDETIAKLGLEVTK